MALSKAQLRDANCLLRSIASGIINSGLDSNFLLGAQVPVAGGSMMCHCNTGAELSAGEGTYAGAVGS